MKDIILLGKIVAGILLPTDIRLMSGDLNEDEIFNLKDIIALGKAAAGVN